MSAPRRQHQFERRRFASTIKPSWSCELWVCACGRWHSWYVAADVINRPDRPADCPEANPRPIPSTLVAVSSTPPKQARLAPWLRWPLQAHTTESENKP